MRVTSCVSNSLRMISRILCSYELNIYLSYGVRYSIFTNQLHLGNYIIQYFEINCRLGGLANGGSDINTFKTRETS